MEYQPYSCKLCPGGNRITFGTDFSLKNHFRAVRGDKKPEVWIVVEEKTFDKVRDLRLFPSSSFSPPPSITTTDNLKEYFDSEENLESMKRMHTDECFIVLFFDVSNSKILTNLYMYLVLNCCYVMFSDSTVRLKIRIFGRKRVFAFSKSYRNLLQ